MITAGLFLRTARHLKAVQVANRVWRSLVKRRTITGPALPLRQWHAADVPPIPREAAWDGASGFNLLNQTHGVTTRAGWNDPERDPLWLYHLHYFDDLAAPHPPARATALIRRWLAENPVGHGVGWDPYPTSLRIVNWIKWHRGEGSLDPEMVRSLANQVRHLLPRVEYHLLGNHVLANAKALVAAGLFFDGEEAHSWLRRGRRLLEAQLAEQILGDGAHFELSPSYHAILTEDVLDLVNFGRAAGIDTQKWEAYAVRMLAWLAGMLRPDGRWPLFNDASYGVAPEPAAVFEYAGRLGFAPPARPPLGLCLMEASGYVRFSSDRFWTVFDFGQVGPDYIPGHAHCDMGSFELAIGSTPVIVDTGVSTYNAGSRRLAERGTAAHNTVQVGDAEQSEIWSSFRMGRRARLFDRTLSGDGIAASHDGFSRLGLTHRREVRFAPDRLIIHDTLLGDGEAGARRARFHFHPEIAPLLRQGRVTFAGGEMRFAGAQQVVLEPYEYAPAFNVRIPAQLAVVTFDRRLTSTIMIDPGP